MRQFKLQLVVTSLFLFTISCKEKTKDLVNNITSQKVDSLSIEFNTLLEDFSSDSISKYFTSKWYNYYQENIKSFNPNFDFTDLDSIEYFLIPALNVPIDKIKNDRIDIYTLLKKGSISKHRSVIYATKNNKLLGIIDYDSRLRPQIFHPAMQNSNIEFLYETNLFFKLNIIDQAETLLLPGIFYLDKNQIKNINNDNTITDLNQYVLVNYKSIESFERMIKSF